jgi:hypothetical protein
MSKRASQLLQVGTAFGQLTVVEQIPRRCDSLRMRCTAETKGDDNDGDPGETYRILKE